MNRFAVIAPADLAGANRLLANRDHAALAGGVDLLDLLKQNIAAPPTLVNLKRLQGLDAIEPGAGGGLKIGALVKLHTLATDPRVRAKYPALADSAGEAATPQIRNLATAGGNLLQRPRCWYFRNPDVNCLKKGGDRCYAVGGLNRYHAILGGGPSFIVHPSNLAPALIAHGASVTLVGSAGARTMELEQFFALPKVDPMRENVMAVGEVLTEINLPAPPVGARSVYLEAREKQSFDWPLVSVAVVVVVDRARVVRSARIVMGAVAPIPWRVPHAEQMLVGARVDPEMLPEMLRELAIRAADAALVGAAPLAENGYKVPIAKVLVRRAILRAAGIEEESA
jgi:xanthine dehydrogenase YagS FAD-binding subunit